MTQTEQSQHPGTLEEQQYQVEEDPRKPTGREQNRTNARPGPVSPGRFSSLPASPEKFHSAPSQPSRSVQNSTDYRTDQRSMPPARKSRFQEMQEDGPSLPVQIPLEQPARPVYKNGVSGDKNGLEAKDLQTPKNGLERDQAGAAGVMNFPAPATQPGPRPEQPQVKAPAKRTAISLERLLELNPGLPVETAVIGVCEDGLPVLLDLNDPAPGALLVISDERENQLELLRAAITSTVKRSSPRSVQFLVLAQEPAAWQHWITAQGYDRHCLSVIDIASEAAGEWILRLADWTEQRRKGERSGPPVLVVIDSLDFLPRLSYDLRLNFDWMVKEAPLARIWPIGCISSTLALAVGGRMLRAFQGRILGYACDPAVYTRLGDVNEKSAPTFGRAGEFAVKVSEDWLRFQVPGKKI